MHFHWIFGQKSSAAVCCRVRTATAKLRIKMPTCADLFPQFVEGCSPRRPNPGRQTLGKIEPDSTGPRSLTCRAAAPGDAQVSGTATTQRGFEPRSSWSLTRSSAPERDPAQTEKAIPTSSPRKPPDCTTLYWLRQKHLCRSQNQAGSSDPQQSGC